MQKFPHSKQNLQLLLKWRSWNSNLLHKYHILWNRTPRKIMHSIRHTFKTSLHFQIFRSCVGQSSTLKSDSCKIRILIGSVLFGYFILLMSYSGNIISFLTVPFFPKKINTIQDLLETNFRLSKHNYTLELSNNNKSIHIYLFIRL